MDQASLATPAEEADELAALAQPPGGHLRAAEHLGRHLGQLPGPEVEPPVERVHRVQDLGVLQVRIRQRRQLRAPAR